MLPEQAFDSCRRILEGRRTKWVVSSRAALVTGPSRLDSYFHWNRFVTAGSQVEQATFSSWL